MAKFLFRPTILIFIFYMSMLTHVYATVGKPEKEAYLSLFNAGEEAYGQKNFETAIQHYSGALAIAPEQLRSRFRLGQSLMAIGKVSESMGQFQTILEKYPNNIAARICLSQNLIKMGRAEEAKTQLEWIIKVQPEHAEAKNLLASLPASTVLPIVNPKDGKEIIPDGFQPLPVRKEVQTENDAFKPLKTVRTKKEKEKEGKLPPPPVAKSVKGWRVSDYISLASGSYFISIEYAKYCLEKNDLKKAHCLLDLAEEKAAQERNTRKFLEVQIHKSLLLLYEADITNFGKQLIKIKPLLSKETYTSFLDIYNKAVNASSSTDVAKLVGGIALGAEHYAVAERILSEVFNSVPTDAFSLRLLAHAQLENLDYNGAERSLTTLATLLPRDTETYFNLARFYLTAKFNPGNARHYAQIAAQLNPSDSRITVLTALIDYSTGKVREGIFRLKKSLNDVNDPMLLAVCKRVISDGEYVRNSSADGTVDFAKILALPGSERGSIEAMNGLGEEYLKRGSYFLALRCFMDGKDLAEIGRGYLALASHLHSAGDDEGSALAAGFGINSLTEELRRNPSSAKAHLYLSLYYFEREDPQTARRHIATGLSFQPNFETKRHLVALRSLIGS